MHCRSTIFPCFCRNALFINILSFWKSTSVSRNRIRILVSRFRSVSKNTSPDILHGMCLTSPNRSSHLGLPFVSHILCLITINSFFFLSFFSHFLSLRYSRWFCKFLSMSINTVEYAYFILRSYSAVHLGKFSNLFGRLAVSRTAVKRRLHLTPLFLIWILFFFMQPVWLLLLPQYLNRFVNSQIFPYNFCVYLIFHEL